MSILQEKYSYRRIKVNKNKTKILDFIIILIYQKIFREYKDKLEKQKLLYEFETNEQNINDNSV